MEYLTKDCLSVILRGNRKDSATIDLIDEATSKLERAKGLCKDVD